jgi:sodium/proline symporter
LLAIAAIISLMFFSIYVGAQFIPFGNLFGANTGAIIVLGAALVMLYALLGSFWSMGMTDLIQGPLMVSALVLIFGIIHTGGFEGVANNLRNFPGFLVGTTTPL